MQNLNFVLKHVMKQDTASEAKLVTPVTTRERPLKAKKGAAKGKVNVVADIEEDDGVSESKVSSEPTPSSMNSTVSTSSTSSTITIHQPQLPVYSAVNFIVNDIDEAKSMVSIVAVCILPHSNFNCCLFRIHLLISICTTLDFLLHYNLVLLESSITLCMLVTLSLIVLPDLSSMSTIIMSAIFIK
jgi:hypothetical protein